MTEARATLGSRAGTRRHTWAALPHLRVQLPHGRLEQLPKIARLSAARRGTHIADPHCRWSAMHEVNIWR
jgi:hypothetical protein